MRNAAQCADDRGWSMQDARLRLSMEYIARDNAAHTGDRTVYMHGSAPCVYRRVTANTPSGDCVDMCIPPLIKYDVFSSNRHRARTFGASGPSFIPIPCGEIFNWIFVPEHRSLPDHGPCAFPETNRQFEVAGNSGNGTHAPSKLWGSKHKFHLRLLDLVQVR